VKTTDDGAKTGDVVVAEVIIVMMVVVVVSRFARI